MKDSNISFFPNRWTTLAIIYSVLYFSFIFNLSSISTENHEVKYEFKHHYSNSFNFQLVRSEQNAQKSSNNFNFFLWYIQNLSLPRLFFYKLIDIFNFPSKKSSPSFYSVNRARAPPIN